MSAFQAYKTKTFNANQKFFVLDPNTGSPSFVQGSDLVSQLTPNSNYVYSESTRTTAQATDYAIGSIVQTGGAEDPGDNLSAVYLVVAAGEGDFPMHNGNELLIVAGDDSLQERLISSDPGDGSDLVAHTGTANSVTEAINQNIADIAERVISVTSRTAMKAYNVPPGTQFSLEEGGRFGLFVRREGSPPVTDTQEGFYVIANAGGYDERVNKYPATPEMFGALFDGSDDSAAWNGLADVIDAGATVTSTTVGGTSTCNSAVTFAKDVIFDLPNITAVMNGGDFNVTGALSTVTATLTADADKGDTGIAVDDESGFSSGDLIAIQNDDDFSFSAHRSYYKDGEFITVRDTAAGVVNFDTGLKSSYLTTDTILFYKIDPIKLKARGLNVRGPGASQLLSVDLVKDFDIAECSAIGGTTASLQLSRCYGGTITGGEFKHFEPAAGLNYGIVFANCQDVTVVEASAHGTRHGVATGGSDGDAVVPCRGLRIVRSTVSSTDSHGSDIHGNAEDCYYVDCDISNGTGIGGRNCGIRGGTVSVPSGYGQKVLQVTDAVGGVIEFTGIRTALPEDSVQGLYGVNSSATVADVKEDIKYLIDDVDLFIPASNTASALGSFVNTADGALVEWEFQNTRMRVRGDVSSLDRICNLALSNPSGFATPPNNIKKLIIDDIDIDYSGLNFWVANSGGAMASGSIVTMPKIEFSGNQTISSGGFASAGLALSFPSYTLPPSLYPAYTGAGVVGTTYVLPLCSALSATSATVILTTMHTSETVGVDVTERVSARVGFDNFVWP